jgi:hypothetical protein
LCCGGDGSRSWSRWRTRVSTSRPDSVTSSTLLSGTTDWRDDRDGCKRRCNAAADQDRV